MKASDAILPLIIELPNLQSGAKPLEMVLIPAGTFIMGSPEGELGREDNEYPQREITFSRSFYLSRYEVTQAQWEAVIGNNPSYYSTNSDHPVENVSWEDCLFFTTKLNQMGLGTFRLPTEAEWEYAYRAGTVTRFPWGEDLNESEN